MPEEPLHHPHDKLFKVAFGQPETAAAAFQAYLPAGLTRPLDLSQAELVPGTFVDEHFKALESDLLYKIPHRDSEVYVYLLFEHQAEEDSWTALRLLTYMCRIWERYRRENPPAKSLPVILPLVLAQQAGEWRQPPTFAALFDLTPEQQADYAGVIPDFTFQLLALARHPFEQMVGTPMGTMTLRVLRAYSLGALASEIVWDDALLASLSHPDRMMILRYVIHLGGIDTETFLSKLKQLKAPELRDLRAMCEELERELP